MFLCLLSRFNQSHSFASRVRISLIAAGSLAFLGTSLKMYSYNLIQVLVASMAAATAVSAFQLPGSSSVALRSVG